MSHKPEDASDLYRQFRTVNAQDRDTADAVECFSRHLGTEQTHQARVDQIVAAIPDRQPAREHSQHNFILAVMQWFAQWIPSPTLKFAVLGLCGFLAFGLLVNQKPYPWATLVPSTVIEAGLQNSNIDVLGVSTQMGFTPSGDELALHYSLGKISTQLALSMALNDDSLMPYFAANFKRISSAELSPEISQQVKALTAQLSEKTTGREIGQTLAELKQTVNKQSQQPFNGFALGQHIESLSLALRIADSQDNVVALKDVSADIAALRIDKWHSNELPKLNAVLVQIHGLVQGNLSLPERRQLIQLIQQLNVLLA